jgi:predicted lipoprotein with Yx(FWY)xxD motif
MNSSIRRVSGLALLAGLALAACTSGASTAPSSPAPNSPAPAGAATEVNSTTSATLGQILNGPDGKTLYVFAKDGPNQTNCTAACAQNWPPLTVTAGRQPGAGSGVTGQIGTLVRPDGPTQVSYNSQPLYYFSGDTKPGDTNGQGVGGVWSAAKASGGSAPAASGAPPAPSASNPASPAGGYHY